MKYLLYSFVHIIWTGLYRLHYQMKLKEKSFRIVKVETSAITSSQSFHWWFAIRFVLAPIDRLAFPTRQSIESINKKNFSQNLWHSLAAVVLATAARTPMAGRIGANDAQRDDITRRISFRLRMSSCTIFKRRFKVFRVIDFGQSTSHSSDKSIRKGNDEFFFKLCQTCASIPAIRGWGCVSDVPKWLSNRWQVS